MDQAVVLYRDIRQCLQAGSKDVIAEKQQILAEQLELLLREIGLKATIKADSKWITNHIETRTQHQFLERTKGLLAKITSARTYQRDDIQVDVLALSMLKLKDLKEIAKSLGVRPTSTKPAIYLLELLEKASGVLSVAVDETVISRHVQTLKSIYSRAKTSLPEAEIKDEMKQLKALEVGELSRIAEDFGLDQPGKNKPQLLKRIESKLKATYNAYLEGRV